jgi:hypothetical protein
LCRKVFGFVNDHPEDEGFPERSVGGDFGVQGKGAASPFAPASSL